jgi:hypothetical protein
MSKQETAVEWLENQISCYASTNPIMNNELFILILKKTKEIEKEQIMDAGNCVAEVVLTDDESYNGNKYWNEFYGGDHE